MDLKAIKLGLKASLITSSCCSLPLALILIFSTVGAGSMTAALKLPKYKILFWSMGVVFLAISIYLSLKKRCNGTCTINDVKNEKKFIFISVVTYIILSFIIIYWLLPIISELLFG